MVDAFPQLLFKGITVTIPLTIISFALSMVIAVVAAVVLFFAAIKLLDRKKL